MLRIAFLDLLDMSWSYHLVITSNITIKIIVISFSSFCRTVFYFVIKFSRLVWKQMLRQVNDTVEIGKLPIRLTKTFLSRASGARVI